MHRGGVFLGIEQFLVFQGFAQLLIRLRKRNGADPRHKKLASNRGSCLTIRGQQTYIEAVWCANTQIVLVGLGGQIHLAEIPRAEDRVDEHRSVESAAPATQAVVAGPAVLCVGRGVPGLGWIFLSVNRQAFPRAAKWRARVPQGPAHQELGVHEKAPRKSALLWPYCRDPLSVQL